ncbi:MAG: Zn-ribbon domain-containing OB-fold protein [Candidatus Bathyarchaeia archaeon]
MSEFTSKNFADSLAEGKIRGSKCAKCNAIHLPPRPVCPECGGSEMTWVDVSGDGVLRAFTIVHVPLSTMMGRSPYAVAVVKLDDGPSISGLLLGVDRGDTLSVGARVVAEFVKEGEKTVLCFKIV